jgi:hypothetical protein
VQGGLGDPLIQQGHMWLVDPPPAVCEMVGLLVVLAAIWTMEHGRKRLWSFVHTPPMQGSAVQQAVSKDPPPPGLPRMISAMLPGIIGQFWLRAGMQSALIISSCLFASRLPHA